MDLSSKLEAIFFYKSEPVAPRWLASHLGEKESAVWEALHELESKLKVRGIRVIFKDDSVLLATAPEAGELVEKIAKEELNKDLGKAALETLTVVLYRGPISKSEIDYIRGVNSSFILRNLLIRGLVEREVNPEDQRGFLYRPTAELFSYLGITKREELPEYNEVQSGVEKFEKEFKNEPHEPDQETKNDTNS